MSETKPSMAAQTGPNEKPTVKFEPPPDWAIALKEQVENGFRGLRADISLVANDVTVVRDRVVILERWKVETEERQAKHSGGVRQLSETDAKHDAAIAKVIERVDGIEKKVDELVARPDTAATVLAEVKKLSDKPWAKKLGTAVLGVLMLAISFIGIRLQMAVTKLEEKPATVQPAPTVYLPAPADGGAK